MRLCVNGIVVQSRDRRKCEYIIFYIWILGFGFVLLKIFGEHTGIIVYSPVTATPYGIDTHTAKTASQGNIKHQ